MEFHVALFCVFLLSYIFYILVEIKRWKRIKLHWESVNVPVLRFKDVCSYLDFYIKRKVSFTDLDTLYYNHLKSKGYKIGVVMELMNPTLIVADAELVKLILVKDAEYFVDRRKVQEYQDHELLNQMLLNLEGDQWKETRAALSSSFSTARLKVMFKTFQKYSKNISTYITANVTNDEGVDFNEISLRYIVDVTMETVFCQESDALINADSDHFKAVKCFQSQYDARLSEMLRWFIVNFPSLAKTFGLISLPKSTLNYFTLLASNNLSTKQFRNGDGMGFLQLFLEANEKKQRNWSSQFIVAQLVSFILAAVEGPTTLLTFSTLLLAIHPEWQTKVREEACRLYTENEKFSYDDFVGESKTTDLVLNEALRLFPPGIRTERVCTRDYRIPCTDVMIKKGTLLCFPIFALQHDDRYFPNPSEFNPLRDDNNLHKQYAFLPFGHGPRNCIGQRFALQEVKVALLNLARNYVISPSAKGRMNSGKISRDKVLLKFTKINK